MMFFSLLASIFLHVALASACRGPVKMSLSQDSLVPRPAGEVVLTCVVTGLGYDAVKTLSWTKEEINSPSEILSDSTHRDVQAFKHPPHVSNDDFDSSSRTESLLRLNISMGSPHSYSCKLLTYNGESCSETMQVMFKDPRIEIKFDRGASSYDNVKRTLLINVTCIVDASYGKPQIVLSYFGSEGTKVGRREHGTVTKDNTYYFQGSHWALLQLPTTGSVYCRVIDERGIYRATSPITTFTSDCPDLVTIKVRQPRFAARPNDTITMECSVVGVSSGDVEFYMWTIEETNQPIYIFSDIHKIDEINEDYREHVLKEKQELRADGITSIITLNVNIANRNTYKCDVKVRNKNCIDTAPVMFQDPKLDIKFEKIPVHGDEAPDGTVTAVICRIDVASGEPQFALTYQGEKEQNYRQLSIEPYKRNHGFYFSAHSIAIVRLPDAGKVVCRITDSITTYEISQQIIPPMRDLYAGKLQNVIAFAIPIALVLAILPLIFFVCRKAFQNRVSVKDAAAQTGFPYLLNFDGTSLEENKEIFAWKWSKILTISRHPRLYVEQEPLSTDIQQVNGAADDNWFLAALNSLCVSHSHDPSNNYFARIFGKVEYLTASEIPIMIWRFGEWREVQVTPTLPSRGGQLYYVHSENKNVFWSALLQKAIAMLRHANRSMDVERDIHLLEDLSGEVVVTHESKDWYDLCSYIMEHRPICCRQLVGKYYMFYSITGLRREETTGEYQIKLRGFVSGQAMYSFQREKVTSLEENDEFFIRKSVFQLYFREYNVLTSETIYFSGHAVKMLEYTDFDGNGHWKQTNSDKYTHCEKRLFWTNPQYILEFDESQVPEGQELKVRIVLMQKERWATDIATTVDDPLIPLRIGIDMFQIWDSTFHPTVALEHYYNALGPSHFSIPPKLTRKVTCWWSGKSSDRLVVVPFAGGGRTPGDFLIRIHTNNKEALRFRLLPCIEEDGPDTPLLKPYSIFEIQL